MKYRIVKETYNNGEEIFFIQQRFLFFFWIFKKQKLGHTNQRIYSYSLDDAIDVLQILSKSSENPKLVKTEIIPPPY